MGLYVFGLLRMSEKHRITRRRIWGLGCLVGGLACLVVGMTLAWYGLGARLAPSVANGELFQGVSYERHVQRSPYRMVYHVVVVDLNSAGIATLVTPGDAAAELPLRARTTSEFVEEFDVQLAINGDAFYPWYSNGPFDYYPRPGERVQPVGFAASEGRRYSENTDNEPVIYFGPNNQASFSSPVGRLYNAISGTMMLVKKGKAVSTLDTQDRQPRTAVGLDKARRRLILIVVDGRQPGYSAGATLEQLADILVAAGAFEALNLDGGGSSTLVMQSPGGQVVLNSPIHNRIPGRERPVGNHLGIFAARK